ncbi:hypothetical protein M8C21_001651 [Ambrosia artemisiifolia]|uniref:Uncharacterized protein n=1 Tax=Ambrosia artemisiifolia TaxID=4212 RepID=A0AAD5CXU0_AMBAR|nr:hypothetical protein M8C21_001651 [Ambrosia artemisiifolia]
MECMAQEPVLFEDILCQIVDMIGPKDEGYFTLRDLKGSKLAGSVFNILFNLNKFMAFETRDPFLIRQERENPTLTEWDRFAHREYIRLSMEEDADDASNGSVDAGQIEEFFNLSCGQQKHVKFLDIVASYAKHHGEKVNLLAEFRFAFPAEHEDAVACSMEVVTRML